MTFDRDTRWVGSYGLRHFPSAFCRFLLCLGIQPTICPPRRPDKNAYVERLHRTLNQEWGLVHLPSTLGEVREATKSFLWHDNQERPQEANGLWQSATTGRLSQPACAAALARTSRPRSLARCHPWAGVFPQSGH